VLESLRLMPPVWLLGRRAERPVEVCGRHIPAGAFVLVSPWILHRRSDLYPEPDRFDPTRFVGCPPKYGYVPFGAGPRRCIGDDLSLQILERILSVARERGRIEVEDPWAIPEAAGITVRPRGPVRARWSAPQEKRALSVIDSTPLNIAGC
jgi:cytochrome P450